MTELWALLARHLPEAWQYLQPEELDQVAGYAAVLADQAEDDDRVRGALNSLSALLVLRLPPDHAIVVALAGQLRLTPRVPASQPELLRIRLAMETLAQFRLERAAGGEAGPDDAAEGWLLAAPALTEQQVRAAGGDPRSPGLIRLPRPGGPVALPEFQFGPGGAAKPVVAEINLLLDAAGDPWGVADWWLGENAWLDGVPAHLLGRVPDMQLVLAAQAEIPAE